MGKRTHDARIIAAMLANGITHLLTFDPSDFTGISSITIIHPQDLPRLTLVSHSVGDRGITQSLYRSLYLSRPFLLGFGFHRSLSDGDFSAFVHSGGNAHLDRRSNVLNRRGFAAEEARNALPTRRMMRFPIDQISGIGVR